MTWWQHVILGLSVGGALASLMCWVKGRREDVGAGSRYVDIDLQAIIDMVERSEQEGRE